MPRVRRYTTSPHVIAHWDDGSIVLQNYALATRARGTRALGSIAHACAQPRSLTEIREICPELSIATIRRVVRLLVERRILHEAHRPMPPAEYAMAQFAGWNPEAGLFHTATKNVRFGNGLDIDAGPNGEATRLDYARSYARRGRALPGCAADGQFPRVLRERRTWRRFSREPVSLRELSNLLWLTFGVQHRLRLSDGSDARMRTSPSGGARHPIEACIAIRDVQGLRAGLYRYDSDTHRLHRKKRTRESVPFGKYLPGQPWYAAASLVVFFVATFARTRSRYPYSRAYRAVLIEAGHLCQTFCLTATWLGLAPFSTLALADRVIEADFGLDGIEESAIYAAGAGRRLGSPETCMAPVGAKLPIRRTRRMWQHRRGADIR